MFFSHKTFCNICFFIFQWFVCDQKTKTTKRKRVNSPYQTSNQSQATKEERKSYWVWTRLLRQKTCPSHNSRGWYFWIKWSSTRCNWKNTVTRRTTRRRKRRNLSVYWKKGMLYQFKTTVMISSKKSINNKNILFFPSSYSWLIWTLYELNLFLVLYVMLSSLRPKTFLCLSGHQRN